LIVSILWHFLTIDKMMGAVEKDILG
jgi:hypothetical protein